MNISYGTIKLSEVFTKIKNGVITVPSFQRSFDWSARDIARMYNSVMHRKEPFGSIVIWDDIDNSVAIPNDSKIFKQIQEKHSDNNKTYLIDGQQRVTSFLMSYLWNNKPKAKHISKITTIRYDLDKKEFLVLNKEKGSYIKPFLFAKESREDLLKAVEEELKGRQMELSREQERNLLSTYDAFANVDIGTTTIFSNDLNEVIDVFTLINTKGKKLTPFNIVHAQYISNGDGFNLASKYEDIINKHKDKWKISNGSLLLLQYAVTHNTISNAEILRISSEKAKVLADVNFIEDNFLKLWELTISELKTFGYHTLDSVPSDKFIYLIAKALKLRGTNLSKKDIDIFENWFKMAVLNNRYSSGGEGAKINGFRSDWAEIESQLESKTVSAPSWTKITKFTAQDIKELNYNKVSLIYKYVVAKMVDNIPSIKTGKLVKWDDISDLKKLNLHHLIPSGHPDFKDEDEINSIANLTPLGAKDNIVISNYRLSVYIKELIDDPNEYHNYLLDVTDFDDLHKFVDERSEALARKLNKEW